MRKKDTFRQELLQVFPRAKVYFEAKDARKLSQRFRLLRPDFMLYDSKSIYFVVKYKGLSAGDVALKFERRPEVYRYYDESIEMDIRGYFRDCRGLFGKDVATCIINLFFIIRGKFTAYHELAFLNLDKKSRLVYCAVWCKNEESKLLCETLGIIHSKYNLTDTPFEECVKTITLSGHTIFLMDIATFYHIINPWLWGYKVAIMDKHGKQIKKPLRR
jgi:hypothetical protein